MSAPPHSVRPSVIDLNASFRQFFPDGICRLKVMSPFTVQPFAEQAVNFVFRDVIYGWVDWPANTSVAVAEFINDVFVLLFSPTAAVLVGVLVLRCSTPRWMTLVVLSMLSLFPACHKLRPLTMWIS